MYDRTEQRTPDQIDSPVGCYLQLVKTNKTNTVQVYQLQSGALSLVQILQILGSHWLAEQHTSWHAKCYGNALQCSSLVAL